MQDIVYNLIRKIKLSAICFSLKKCIIQLISLHIGL